MFEDLINNSDREKNKVDDKSLIDSLKFNIENKNKLIKKLISKLDEKEYRIEQLIKKVDYLENL